MILSERQKQILLTIVQEYIANVQPISSGILVNKLKLKVSSATVRNDMADLEEANYIYQPHTSAGRIPTDLAYSFFVEHLLSDKQNITNSNYLSADFSYSEESLKKLARSLSELSGLAVFWALHKNNLYYTGISNLFIQPEFKESNLVCDVSVIIDRMEDIIADIFDKMDMGENIYIGKDNPFGQFLSTITLKYKYQNQSAVVGIMGPLRMDYKKNLKLIFELKDKLIK